MNTKNYKLSCKKDLYNAIEYINILLLREFNTEVYNYKCRRLVEVLEDALNHGIFPSPAHSFRLKEMARCADFEQIQIEIIEFTKLIRGKNEKG